MTLFAIDSDGGVVVCEVFASADFVEPYGGSGSVHSPFDILVGEYLFCLFGTSKLYIRMTVHL